MNGAFSWWLVILGIAVGMAVVWMVMARLPRTEDDVSDDEVGVEAGWISRTINAYGGVAPQPLVEEVLELHRQYIAGPVQEPPQDLLLPDEPALVPGVRADRVAPPEGMARYEAPDQRTIPVQAPAVEGADAATAAVPVLANAGDGSNGGVDRGAAGAGVPEAGAAVTGAGAAVTGAGAGVPPSGAGAGAGAGDAGAQRRTVVQVSDADREADRA